MKQGEQLLQRAVALRPAFLDGHNNVCWFNAIYNIELDKGLAHCEEALRIRPDYARALDSLGFMHLRRGEFAKSIEAYDRALERRPGFAYSLYGRGIAKLRSGDKTGGNADLREARKVQSSISQIFRSYGIKP